MCLIATEWIDTKTNARTATKLSKARATPTSRVSFSLRLKLLKGMASDRTVSGASTKAIIQRRYRELLRQRRTASLGEVRSNPSSRNQPQRWLQLPHHPQANGLLCRDVYQATCNHRSTPHKTMQSVSAKLGGAGRRGVDGTENMRI